MCRLFRVFLSALLILVEAHAADDILAPTGTLRVVYLDGNPVQAVRDSASGEIKGVAADIAREMGNVAKVPVHIEGLGGIDAVIDEVSSGRADLGFLAPDPTRETRVQFSQVYLRNPQSVVVPPGSPVNTLEHLRIPGIRIGVTAGDSIGNYLERNYANVQLVRIKSASAADAIALLDSGTVDGFAANETRLRRIVTEKPLIKRLEGSIVGVPQAIVVPKENSERLKRVNDMLSSFRSSGALSRWISAANNGTVLEPAP